MAHLLVFPIGGIEGPRALAREHEAGRGTRDSETVVIVRHAFGAHAHDVDQPVGLAAREEQSFADLEDNLVAALLERAALGRE